MTFPVCVEFCEGQFAAEVLGAPEIRVVGATRSDALAALQAEISTRVERGDLVSLDVRTTGVNSLAGKYAEDPTLREICDEAYQIRNAETGQ
jgi:hypothetical protein